MAPTVRRGSSRDELQTYTTVGGATFEFDGGQPSAQDGQIWDVSPAPGTEWEIHEATFSLWVRVRNPQDEEATVYSLTVAAVTFGDEPYDGYSGNQGINQIIGSTGNPPTVESLELFDEHDHLWTVAKESQHGFQSGALGNATAAGAPRPIDERDTIDFSDNPITLSDTEELSLEVAQHYQTTDDLSGGEEEVKVIGMAQIRYLPKSC